ncbi:sensor domain-containing protein [Mycobacterium sp.]|uniref:sensor domain-containing protein n=1 Tax=Mycobacterium sp. TaxID=1785 RepID=UPI003C75F622
MSNPQDPFGRNPFSYDPLGRVPIEPAPPAALEFPEPPAPPRRVNAFATLSLLFAFVFAPAGAILGHLGLAQIRRTGEAGRDRALVGVTLSYAFITVAVFALVGWASLAVIGSNRSHRTAAPATASETPPPPTVAPADLAKLLPGITDVKKLTGDQNLVSGQTWDHIAKGDREGTLDRPECWGSIGAGTPDAYNVEAVFGYHASEFSDTRDPGNSMQVIAGVAAFRDADAAQNQLTQLLSGWKQCGGANVKLALPSGQTLIFALGAPTDAGNGITTIEVETKGLRRSVRAMAAKANVITDLNVSYSASAGPTDRAKPAVAVANYILGKIPG